jgi:hypothetical protein
MKKIDTTQETATAWSPFKVESKEFLQKSYREMVDSVIRSIVITNLGTYSSTTPYVVEGCVLTNSNKDISAGIVFYGGNFYNVSAITSGTAPLEFQLESSADGTADPTTFSDGSPHSIHLDYHFTTYSAGAAPSPTFNATALVNLYGVKTSFTYQSPNQNTTSTSFIDLTGSTYTTPNDGKTRTWLIQGKTNVRFAGSTGDGGKLKILVDGVQKDISESFLDIIGTNVDLHLQVCSCMALVSVAPNKVIKLQIASTNGGGIDFNNNNFVVIEL